MASDQFLPRLKRASAVGLAIVFGIGLAGEAEAQSAFCRQVQADYLRADRGSGGGGRGDIGKLQRQLADAQNDARRAGCRRLLFGKPGKNCPAILARINKLQRELGRARTGGGGFAVSNNRFERDRLRGILLRNGCEVPSRGGGSDFAGSGYRTLCVRTCDGYYFPISFSTSRSRFKIDEAVCQSMYGGAPAELFVHYNGSPSDTAVSLKGEPLASSTNAFAYRYFYSQSCQAQLHTGLASLAEAFLARMAEAQSNAPPEDRAKTVAPKLLPRPMVRVEPGQDPETLANLGGGFTVRPVRSPEEAAVASASEPMRKLGPAYYYTTPIAVEGLRDPPQRGPVFSLIGSAHADEADDGSSGETSVQ
ncbi:MAG TPA: DUF2865 domain-containing protein [Bauldia sp.]|nr:DUF2865 domain-containing protein [Bauldia sp.]